MRRYLLEVETELKKLGNKIYRESNNKFNIPRSCGVASKKLKDRLTRGFSFSKLSDIEQWKIWNFIMRNSRLHEAQMAALRFAEEAASRYQVAGKEWNFLRGWVDFIDNWAQSDVLSKIYSFLLEQKSDLILPTLKKWNKSKNPWKQRASVVSLIYYASPKRKAPPVKVILEMVEPLLKEKDKYVQKGIGWTLRESYKLYPKETFEFLNTHIKQLSSDAFSYATEKLTKIEKNNLLEKRKIKE